MSASSDARPLRIAYLVPTFPELSNTFVLNQITGMIDRGHEVDIFAPERKGFAGAHAEVASYRLDERMRHLRIPSNRLARAGAALRHLASPALFRRSTWGALDPRAHGRQALSLGPLFTNLSFARRGAYDILHCQFGQLGPLGRHILDVGATRARLVTSFRGADVASHVPRAPERYRKLFARGDLFLPVSDTFRQALIAYGCPSQRVEVHHSGIAVSRFAFRERKFEPSEPIRLLFVGRLAEKKGARYAIEALAKFRASGCAARLTVVGDGPLRDELVQLAARLEVASRVAFVGRHPQNEIIELMHASQILVAPSVTARSGDQEGIPNVLKEAMATGMPVVSTQHSGIPELVEDGVSGFLVPERDPGELAHKLSWLVEHPERWSEMGRAGRAKVEAEFDIERLNDVLEAAYRALLPARPLR